MSLKWTVSILAFLVLFSSCKTWKRDIILRFDEEFSEEDLQKSVDTANENYIISIGDFLRVDVFTNDGERLVDPNNELAVGQGNFRNNQGQQNEPIVYLVQTDGQVKLPIVGMQKIDELTINEAEELLEEAFSEFYVDSFVKIRPTNRRVTLLGAFESGGAVVQLPNENITIMELLGIAGGLSQGADASKIKLVRGNINDPKVFSIDLTTINGMTKTGMIVEPGDIIYVEPWRRPVRQTLSDAAPLISLATSLTTIIIVIANQK